MNIPGASHRSRQLSKTPIVNKGVKALIDEYVERMLSLRVWSLWWLNRAVENLLRFRNGVEGLREKYVEYGDSIGKFINALDEVIKYAGKTFRRYWFENNVADEIMELTEKIKSNTIETTTTKTISIKGDRITINISSTNTGTVYKIRFKKFKGTYINVPPLIPDSIRTQFQIGLLNTDGYIKDNHPGMTTANIWQVIIWLLSFPGPTYVRITGLDLNKNGVKIVWELRNLNNEITEKPQLLNNLDDITFFAAVLGDGMIELVKRKYKKRNSTYIYPRVRLAANILKTPQWEDALKRLYNKYGKKHDKNTGNAVFSLSESVDFLKRVYETITAKSPLLMDILSLLRTIDDAEKIRRFMRFAKIKIRKKGESSVNIVGIRFTVVIRRKAALLLSYRVKRDEIGINKVKRIIESIRNKYGITINAYEYDDYIYIIIPKYLIKKMAEKDTELRRSILMILCKKYKDINDKDLKEQIIKYIRELTLIEETAIC